jgi:hypothetical protein
MFNAHATRSCEAFVLVESVGQTGGVKRGTREGDFPADAGKGIGMRDVGKNESGRPEEHCTACRRSGVSLSQQDRTPRGAMRLRDGPSVLPMRQYLVALVVVLPPSPARSTSSGTYQASNGEIIFLVCGAELAGQGIPGAHSSVLETRPNPRD